MYNKDIVLKKSKHTPYIYFCDSNHPLATTSGVVHYHRHVASLKIGRWLTPDENVHHIDGNIFNNSPDNLQILSSAEHAKIHGILPAPLPKRICLVCNKIFSPRRKQMKCCSSSCYSISTRRFNIPKEELQQLVWEMPTSKIAKLFSVSDSAIAKRCRKFSIDKPPRGYWAKIYGDIAKMEKQLAATQ